MNADRYERYLENNREERRGFIPRAANAVSGQLFGLKAGLVAFGGYAAIKAIGVDSILSATSKVAGKATRGAELATGIGEGIFRTARSEGWGSILNGRASSKLGSNITEALRPWSNSSKNLGGALFRGERGLNALAFDLKNITGPRGWAAEGVRSEKVLEETLKRTASRTGAPVSDEIAANIKKMTASDSYPFRAGWNEAVDATDVRTPAQRINDAVDYHNKTKNISSGFTGSESIIMDRALESLKEVLSETADPTEFYKANKVIIDERTKKLQESFVEGIIDSASKSYGGRNEVKNNVLKGKLPYRKATFADLKNNPELADRVVNYETKESAAALLQKAKDNIPEWNDALRNRLDEMVIDPSLLIKTDANGRIVRGGAIDYRGIVESLDRGTEFMAREFQIPFIGIRPFVLAKPFVPHSKNEFMHYVFRAGDVANIGKTFGETANRTFFVGGSLIDEAGETLEKNVYLTRFGSHRKALIGMDPTSRFNDYENIEMGGLFGKIRSFADIGFNENRGIVGNTVSMFTKFGDPYWSRTALQGIKGGSGAFKQVSYLEEMRKKAKRIIESNARGFTTEEIASAKDAIISKYGQGLYDSLTSGSDMNSVLNPINRFLEDPILRKRLNKKDADWMQQISEELKINPEKFYSIKTSHQDDVMNFADNILDLMNITPTKPVYFGETYKKELHRIIYDDIFDRSAGNFEDVLDNTFRGLSESQKKNIRDMDLYSRFLGFEDNNTSVSSSSFYNFITGKFRGEDAIRSASQEAYFEKVLNKAEPFLGSGPKPKPAQVLASTRPAIIRQSKIQDMALQGINDAIASGEFDIKQIWKSFKGVANQVIEESGFGGAGRAGRGNLNKATEFTTGIYNIFNRLNEGLQAASIGLSKRHTGSTQDIAANLLGRRILLPMLIGGYIVYSNDLIGDITGTEPSDAAVKAYGGISLGVQKVKDITGINKVSQKWGGIMAGSDQFWASPVGAPLKWGTFGILGNNQGYEKEYEFLTEGETAIRKGRWWSFGSNTPWRGGRISQWRPSYYRRALGEPGMTDSQWGSEREYWANNWLPTFHNPLGPLKTWVLDPYHWERKHAADRPAAVYGGIPELEAVPILGGTLDSTIGRLFKPFRKNPDLAKAHRQYITEINEAIKSNFEQEAGGAMLYVTPGGRITPKQMPQGGIQGGGSGYGVGIGTGGDGSGVGYGYGGEEGLGGIPEGMIPVSTFPSTISKPGRGARASRSSLTAINMGYMNVADMPDIDTRSIQGLEDSRLAEALTDAADPNSVAYRLNETSYGIREIMGLRGFAMNTFLGEGNKPDILLESSSRAYGYERRFWDLEMGGRGKDVSEIYRRFLPHRRRDVQEYNPIRNTMPSWMPSNKDYFVDFQHGDPYLKVQYGEGMLPGEGYESINKLHPDAYFGRYGALDRMKILGGVAPWSKQYAYYSGVVSQMYQAGLYSEEEYNIAQRVRDQVSARKKKYDFYNYKFKEAGLKEQTVTVSRVIDPYTFMTEEYGNVPIKMAGIKGPKSPNTKQGAEVAAISAQYIQAGQKLKIGISEDPLKIMKGDVMNSINAVVYSGNTKVQDKMLRSEHVKANYNATDAASINALYNGLERTVGAIWETAAHLDSPINTKFMNVRSPLEQYERNIVYGKDFQTWEHPLRDWIKPTLNKMSKQNPFVATAGGALLGSLFGKSGTSKAAFAVIGGAAGAIGSGGRTIKESIGRMVDEDYTWIPEEERRVREVEEYFDYLKYVKYKGLYAKTARAAKKYEGIDVEELLGVLDENSTSNSIEARQLKKVKAAIKATLGDPNVDQQEAQARLDSINEQLKEIAGHKQGIMIGPIATQAIEYKEQYESTLFGADPNGDLLKIYQALPKRDRPFFQEFLKAKPEERERILRLVPENQKRFYAAKWGLKPQKAESLTEYFAGHHLPGAQWGGWLPDQSLERIKLKVIDQKGLDISEFGFWEDDLREINSKTPALPERFESSHILDTMKLKSVLEGNGLSNVEVFITKEQTRGNDPLSIMLDVDHDRRLDVIKLFNSNSSMLLA